MPNGFWNDGGDVPISGGWGMNIEVAVADQRELERLRHALTFALADLGINYSGGLRPVQALNRQQSKEG